MLFHIYFCFYPGTSTSNFYFYIFKYEGKGIRSEIVVCPVAVVVFTFGLRSPSVAHVSVAPFSNNHSYHANRFTEFHPNSKLQTNYTPLLLPSYSYNNPSTARATSKTTSTTPRARPPPTPISNVSPQCRGTTRSNGCSTKHQCDQCHPTPTDETTSQSNSSFCNTA